MTDIEKIKDRLDIVDVISSYIEVKKAGTNYRAVCPFHSEKTPSFMINPKLQIYKCFGCGKGGDVINFIQEIERLSFPEALELSAEKAGVEIEKLKPKNPKEKKAKEDLLKANMLAAEYYHYILKTHKLGEIGRKYAKKREITSKEIQKFMFGYAPDGQENLKNFLLKKGFNEKDLVTWGLLVERNLRGKNVNIDKFRERLVQPVRNIKGEVIGFSGRYTGSFKDAPKYLNSPETLVFKKNENLYGLFEAENSLRKEKIAILVEGNIDVVSSHRVGVENILAPLGTAFTANQAKLLKRFADEVYIAFDSDTAGFNATIRTLDILEAAGVRHKVINLDGFQDADEMIKEDVNEWRKRIEVPENTVQYILNRYKKETDLKTADQKSKFADLAIPVLKMIKNEVQKAHYINYVAELVEIKTEVLEKMLQSKKNFRQSFEEVKEKVSKPKLISNTLNPKERLLLAILIQTEQKFKQKFKVDHFEDERVGKLFEDILKNRENRKEFREKLEPEKQLLFDEISLIDISHLNLEDEELEIFKMLETKRLDKQLKELNKKFMENDEDESYLKKIAEITIEKRKLEKM